MDNNNGKFIFSRNNFFSKIWTDEKLKHLNGRKKEEVWMSKNSNIFMFYFSHL